MDVNVVSAESLRIGVTLTKRAEGKMDVIAGASNAYQKSRNVNTKARNGEYNQW